MDATSPAQGTLDLYPPDFFRREDESEDMLFYAQPRLVVHVEEYVISAIRSFFEETLPQSGVILDLMSSWRSHLPEGFAGKVVGLGLNETELDENPQLDECVVHDLNADPALPFDDRSFEAVVVTVSIQYMVKPVEVFREVHRVLKTGGSFHVVYSNRMFPTKAVSIWQALDDTQKAGLIASYFSNAGGWENPRALDISPRLAGPSDPAYVVTAIKNG